MERICERSQQQLMYISVKETNINSCWYSCTRPISIYCTCTYKVNAENEGEKLTEQGHSVILRGVMYI